MMVTDSSVFSFWYERTEASTPTERRTLTLSRITQYYAFILNAIDLRYKNINETDLALNVLYSGLLIVEDPAVSNWTAGISTNNPDDASRPLVDADQALTSFTTWVQGRTDLPQSDHVMLFTAFDLFYQGSTANAGLAFVGAICGQASTSISENRFDFNGATVAAHELGHSLGAVHDGDNNACQATDSFIMAPSSGLSTDATAQNPWYFSPCSVSDFRKQIDSLDNDANNCLLVESPSLDPTALTPHLQVPPGQQYSIDTQCAYYLGTGSTFCRSFYNETSYPEICGGLFCSIPGTNGCRKTVPARGTSCGPNKWCDSGACVYSADAPDVPAFCPLGEYPGIISGLNLTCAQMIQSRGDVCYQESHNQRCCESCPTIQTGITNCQFGDKSPSCSAITPGQCYFPDNEELCCGTCAGFKRVHLPADCEYGDRASNCAGITAASCYNNQIANLCCETCYNFVTNIPATTVPTTTSTTPPATTVPTTTTTTSTTPLATTVPTPTTSTIPPATTVPTTTSTTPPATTVPTTATTTSTTPLATTVPTTTSSATPPATTMPTTATSTTPPATTVPTATTSTTPPATAVPTTTTTTSTTPLATTVPTTTTSATPPATTMPTTATSTTPPATTVPATTTSTTPPATAVPTTTYTTSTTPLATTVHTTTTRTIPPATTVHTTTTRTIPPATTVPTTTTSATQPAMTVPTSTTGTTPPEMSGPTTSTSTTEPVTTLLTSTTSATQPATTVPASTTGTTPPSVAGTDKSASTPSTIKSIVPTTATNSRSTSTDEETTTIGIATTTEPPSTSTVHTSKPREPGTTQTIPTTTSIKPTSYRVRNDTVTVTMTTDEVTTGMNITVNTGVNTTDPAPPTSVWEEWAGILAGMSAGFGLLVLAPSLVCCLLKCRRQPKDPMDETSETGYVEITPLGSVAGYTDRNWQPGYVWTGQLNRGYTENGRPQKTRQQKENVANHSLARVGTETKSRTTEKDGKNQHHSEKHGFQHGSKGTSLGFHHANSEAEGFLNKAFLSDDSGVSSVSGTNGNARMKMHEVNERFFKNSGFSYGM
ncbi:mucin-2-like isoform X2 [Liolophura sinensis]|uniref:mucin-2-like isoform X2 n=1 Tax=Liolophura sinensis TaxID=3198878 RepID=UPI003158F854